MTSQNNSILLPKPSVSVVKPAVIGAGIALAVILFFILPEKNPDLAWGKYWMVKPLIITPLAGAAGGAFYAFMQHQRYKGFNKTLSILLSIAVYLIGLFMGIVLGLSNTLWD